MLLFCVQAKRRVVRKEREVFWILTGRSGLLRFLQSFYTRPGHIHHELKKGGTHMVYEKLRVSFDDSADAYLHQVGNKSITQTVSRTQA